MADTDTPRVVELETAPEEPDTDRAKGVRRRRRFWFVLIAIFVGIVVYAYAFEKTGVNFDEIEDPTRQASLARIIRALAHPNLLTYESVDTDLDATFMSPCPADGYTAPDPDTSVPYITLSPNCIAPGADVEVSGSNLDANQKGDIYYLADSGVTIRLGDFQTGEDGSFTTTVGTRERESGQPQTIRAVTQLPVGSIFSPVQVDTGEVDPETGEATFVSSPRISKTVWDTWDKIIETVFLALIATTVGTLLAIPLSFFAARNLMRDIAVPLTALTVAILFAIIGAGVGLLLLRSTRSLASHFTGSLAVAASGLVVLLVVIWFAGRWTIPREEEDEPTTGLRIARWVVVALVGVAVIMFLFLLSATMTHIGDWLEPRLGSAVFLAEFVRSLGDILRLTLAVVVVLVTGFVFMFMGSRIGIALRQHLSGGSVALVNLIFAALAGATAAVVMAQLIGWLYEITDPAKTLWIPAIVGAALGLIGALLVRRHETVHIGLTVYYSARTVFNGIRAIEPLVMVIVFVVWVGLGAFAGSIALALHTTAALAKLYSEQVESISLGPIEAVKATGATRMQTIIYAVAPQIVPPYISFTMYRWDINVRMSTIIGFAGGGGIGFLLQQNINLLKYRDAAVQMLAIAIVVASMDYVSSRLRERFV